MEGEALEGSAVEGCATPFEPACSAIFPSRARIPFLFPNRACMPKANQSSHYRASGWPLQRFCLKDMYVAIAPRNPRWAFSD